MSKRTIVISAPTKPIKLATGKDLAMQIMEVELKVYLPKPLSDVDVDPRKRLKEKMMNLIIDRFKYNRSHLKAAKPVENIQVVTSVIELKPRIVMPINRSLISRVAQKIGLRKNLNRHDISAPILQPLGFKLNASKELKAMMVSAKTIAPNNKLASAFPALCRIDEEMEQYKGSSDIDVSDVSSEENWSSSESSSSDKYTTPKASNRNNKYIDVRLSLNQKFAPVIAGSYLATTERHLRRGALAQSTTTPKTTLPTLVFEGKPKPIIAPKPKDLFAKSYSAQPTQNNFLPEITGVKMPLTTTPSSFLRRAPGTLARSRVLAVTSTTSPIQSNQRSMDRDI
ncbi:MAG: hypothetical protein EXR06_00010 [Rickettsiales bacterium]|nr:hypothetical protein [Rickettsiales bacterium]